MRRLIRWYLKKMGRLSFISINQTKSVLRKSSSPPCARVLNYHRFGNHVYDTFCLETQLFEEQMIIVKSSSHALSYTEFINFFRGDSKIGRDSVLITIDDGFVSTYTQAIPILEKYQIPAIIFVSPGEIESAIREPTSFGLERKMTWEEIRLIIDKGFTIGSHGWAHRSMARLSIFDAFEEAYKSRRILEDQLNCEVEAFSYPYGTRRDHNRTTQSLLEKSGYKSAFTAQHGICLPFQNVFTIPRIQIESGESIRVFCRIIEGGLDSWNLVSDRFRGLCALENLINYSHIRN